jgi:3-hydroxyisobutyrate dehydrogenase-like beta-hydroxyacid dehydrogenase
MDKQNVGILHPGEMGLSVAATIQNTGHTVYWASEGRSQKTRARADKQNLVDAHSLAHLCEVCSVIVSVCPPEAAENLAHSVLSYNFTGLYLDANAISPGRTQRIGQAITDAGGAFVDGGIIGGPAWTRGSTWLYLSGKAADIAVDYFSSGPLETCVVGDDIGKASALKMCFAAYTKGTAALLSTVLATAEALNVRTELEQQWSHNGSHFADEASQKVTQVTAKAWRFAGEMEEIAATFQEAGLPDGFHLAAADIYRRMAGFKDTAKPPSLDSVLRTLLGESPK